MPGGIVDGATLAMFDGIRVSELGYTLCLSLIECLAIAKAKLCETRLFLAISPVKALFKVEDFVTLLRVESLDTLPKPLAERLQERGE